MAQATADHPKQAARVIWDAVYVDRTRQLADAYGECLRQKPHDPSRIVSYAQAVLSAVRFCRHQQDEYALDPLNSRAIKLLVPLVLPEQGATPDQLRLYKFEKTKIPEAWIAYGRFLYGPEGVGPIEKGLKLDPSSGDGWFWRADAMVIPSRMRDAKERTREGLAALDKAEKLEPKVHVYALWLRWHLALQVGDHAKAVVYLREFLRLWPTTTNADLLRKDLAEEESLLNKK